MVPNGSRLDRTNLFLSLVVGAVFVVATVGFVTGPDEGPAAAFASAPSIPDVDKRNSPTIALGLMDCLEPDALGVLPLDCIPPEAEPDPEAEERTDAAPEEPTDEPGPGDDAPTEPASDDPPEDEPAEETLVETVESVADELLPWGPVDDVTSSPDKPGNGFGRLKHLRV
jgi:hypothetical protein